MQSEAISSVRKKQGNLFKGDTMKEELDFVREGRNGMQVQGSGICKALYNLHNARSLGKETRQVRNRMEY